MDLSASEIIDDVEFVKDIKGPSLIVRWRGLEIGFVRPLVGRRDFDAETRRKHKGEWYDPFWFHGFHKSREEAACDLIREYVNRNPEDKLFQAALRKDYDFICKWRQELVDSIEIIDE